MAGNRVPKNDFAPAWLKIPDTESSKSVSGKSGHDVSGKSRPARRDDYYNNYNRFPPGTDYYHPLPLQRQRSFDYYEPKEAERRFPQKYRHHSVDDDYYRASYSGYPYYPGYGYDKYGNQFRSQPSLYRDSKYQHPNARFSQPGGAPSQANGFYPPYYEPYYEYYPNGDPYYNGYVKPGTPGKRPHEKDGRLKDGRIENGKGGKSPDSPKDSSRKGSIEEEFPSLNGDSENTENTKPSNQGVWDGHTKDVLTGKSHAALYKALTPHKGTMRKAKEMKGKDITTNGMSPLNSSYSSLGKELGKNSALKQVNGHASSPPLEILNTRLVTQPRNLADKKSDFLKALKDISKGIEEPAVDKQKGENQTGEQQDMVVNGVRGLTVSPDERLLSSSLEAEQRLLREMGWDEADQEDYVITEDDMKEFQILTKQMKEKQNGSTRTLPKTWSPQHLPLYHPTVHDLNDTLSSTSDESDSDVN